MSDSAIANDEFVLAGLVQAACPPQAVSAAHDAEIQRRVRLEVVRLAEQREARRPSRLLALFLHWGIDLALATTVIMLFAALALVVRFEFLTPQGAQQTAVPATLEVLTGSLHIRSGTETERTLEQGARTLVRAGDVIETTLTGQALITYFTGQTTEVGPATRFELLNVSTNGKNSTTVTAKVTQGSTSSLVQWPLPAGSLFELRSPSFTATVHGTEFRLAVLDAERTYVATSKGEVRVGDGSKSVVVRAGEQILAAAGAELQVVPQPPIQGVYIVQVNDTLWRIAARHGLTVQDLLDVNPWIWDADLILPDWKLVIPRSEPAGQ